MYDSLSKFKSFSVAMTGQIHEQAREHLLKFFHANHRQENMCFALWRPSFGAKRATAIVHRLVLPEDGEVTLTGNVSFGAAYLTRASRIAAEEDSGLALMHNHFGPGWQDMSPHDYQTEESRSAFALSSTGLPLVGMTLGTDGAWSARFWPHTGRKQYSRRWCSTVRVTALQLSTTFHPKIVPPPMAREELTRTISAWGPINQAIIARTHVGIVGLGSVGRLVLESLARMGVRRVTLIDFDRIERLNLDRLLCAYTADAASGRLKVECAKEGFLRASTGLDAEADAVAYSVTEPQGFDAALDCDVLFCCVDRPWGRQVLNHIAYAHLIPVIDGGILIRTPAGRFKGAEWSIRTVGPGRRCLKCSRQFEPGMVDMERKGLLDDPSYFEGLSEDERAEASQNVFPFSMCVAGHEIVQFVALITALLHRPDFGEQRYHYNLGEMRIDEDQCEAGCMYAARIATAETEFERGTMTGIYLKANRSREIPPPLVSMLSRPVKMIAAMIKRLLRI